MKELTPFLKAELEFLKNQANKSYSIWCERTEKDGANKYHLAMRELKAFKKTNRERGYNL